MDITKAHIDEELNFPFEVNEKYKRVEWVLKFKVQSSKFK
jgi:hypothetical protein